MSPRLRRLWWLIATIIAAAPVQAQNCQPHWASIDARGLAGYPPEIYPITLNADDGPVLVLTAGYQGLTPVTPPVRWVGQSWVPLPLTGIPKGAVPNGVLYTLNEGAGESLYFRLFDPIGIGMYRFNGASWQFMPGFWPEQWHRRVWSARLWGSQRIFGDIYYSTVAVYDASGWTPMHEASAWRPLGTHHTPSGGTEAAIGFTDHMGDALYIFSSFQAVNNVPARGFARFDGANWTAPWPELVQKGYGIAEAVVFDDGSGPAIFTNHVATINGLARQGLHKWDGTTWTFIGGPSMPPGATPETWDFQVFDDGRGPALYIGGEFDDFGGIQARNLVRYSATGFEPVGGGVSYFVRALGTVRDERGLSLWVLGTHPVLVAGGAAHGLAQWVGCKLPNCYANCDLSSAPPKLTANDFVCFINKFSAKDPYANCDVDAAINASDFMCFLNKFAAGCN